LVDFRGNRFDVLAAGGTNAVKDKNEAFFRQVRVVALAAALPFVMAVGPIAGYLGGQWIGERLGHASWGRLAGLVLGVVAGVHQTVLIIRRILREIQ